MLTIRFVNVQSKHSWPIHSNITPEEVKRSILDNITTLTMSKHPTEVSCSRWMRSMFILILVIMFILMSVLLLPGENRLDSFKKISSLGFASIASSFDISLPTGLRGNRFKTDQNNTNTSRVGSNASHDHPQPTYHPEDNAYYPRDPLYNYGRHTIGLYYGGNVTEYHRKLHDNGYEPTTSHEFQSPYIIDPVIYDDQNRRIKPPGKRSVKVINCYYCPSWFVDAHPHFSKCAYNECRMEFNASRVQEADLAIFFPMGNGDAAMPRRPPGQLWAFTIMESPVHFRYPALFRAHKSGFNWTINYSRSSDVFCPIQHLVWTAREQLLSDEQYKQIARNKTRKVAWAVSNCRCQSQRMEYVKEMQKYIDVDIYGRCGKRIPCTGRGTCMFFFKDYKFYLSFENSICTDYVTEKFYKCFQKGLHLVPVVRGGFDYQKFIPPNTFIDAGDFPSAKALALHLKRLDQDIDAYSTLLKQGAALTAIPYSCDWCSVCERLHTNRQSRTIKDITKVYQGYCKSPKNFL